MNNLNVLILEDELIIYVHLKKTLQKLGFKHVHIARDAQKAFEIASKTKIDILFSDIKINGDIDGIDAARTMQNLYKLPVVFITAYKDQEILLRASEVDFVGYLLKPYRVDELEAIINLTVAKYKLTMNKDNIIKINGYDFDKTNNKLFKDKQEIKLTKKEQLFIALIFNSKGSVVPYTVIDEVIWQGKLVTDNTRRTFLYRIKHKLVNLEFCVQKSLGILLL
ncbi:response regulator [Sulfurimonas sp.]|uniref:response regulator n=1 Tax=Sulfurimonas sp. TaxID=2022749 RepID=UPI002B4648B5|nr:response regulator [Sulfurimonas sp.]